MNDLIIAGKRMSDFGVIVSGGGSYGGPERSYTTADILGRADEIVIDDGFFKPVEFEYSCGVKGADAMDAVRAYIASLGVEDVRIEDSFHREEYYIGHIVSAISPKASVNRSLFNFTLKFKRRPERFLKSGEAGHAIAQNASVTITNNTYFTAYPYIDVVLTPSTDSSGTVTRNMSFTLPVGSFSVKWTSVYLDGKTLRAYCEDKTSKVINSITPNLQCSATWSDERPIFEPGSATFTNTDSSLMTVYPNWYTM